MNKSNAAQPKSTPPAARPRRVSTAATPRTRSPRAARGPSAAERPDEERIRFRAYEISLQRNGHHGDPMEDWLRAERELIEQTPANG